MLSGCSIFAIVVIGLIVIALVFFLVRIISALRQVIDTLGLIVFGVRAIAQRTQPITPVMASINSNLSGSFFRPVAKSRISWLTPKTTLPCSTCRWRRADASRRSRAMPQQATFECRSDRG